MATSTTNLSLIKPEAADTSKIREDFNTNMDTIDGRFAAAYMAVQAKNAVDIDGGSITGITDLVVSDGGTGVSTLTDGGVLLGSGTSPITAMAVLTDGQMIVGNGTTDPVAESGATLRTSIGCASRALDNIASCAINAALLLGTSDAAALGSATKMWADLFLASGAVINFNNGDITLTHSANILTLGGGALALGANNLTMTGSIADTTNRVTKLWATDVEVTNDIAGSITGNAVTFTCTDNESEALACLIVFVDGATGDQGAETDGDLTYNPSTGVLAVPVLTVTGVIATATNISMTGELDITGALGCIDLNPAQQTSKNIIDLTPTATLNATQIWKGLYLNGAALDPNGVDSEIYGFDLDFSGVDETNSPIIHAGRLNVPFGCDALHIKEGQLHMDTVLPATAASEFTGIDVVIDSSALVATSEYHAIDVATTGTPTGDIVAVGTHFGVAPLHQHIATFATPSQTEFAGVKHTGGTVWADGIDAYGVIFAAVSDAIYVGGVAQFDEIEVIMTTGGTKSIQPTFWYNTAADTWTQFYPADDTDGFQQSGEIRWNVSSITATWTGNGDPGGADTTAGYWIKIVRARVGTVGSPDPTTVKIGLATEYYWDKDGNVVVKSITPSTDIAVADGGTGASTASTARTNLGLVIGTNVLAEQTIGIADDNLLEVDDADAADNDFAKFTANGLEGRSYAETMKDLNPITTVTTTHTMTVAEAGTVLVSAASAYTITLPTAVGNAGLTYHFIKTDFNYNLITLDGDGTETFNYENSTSAPAQTYPRLNTGGAEITVASDNSNWQCMNEQMGQVPECWVYLDTTQADIPSAKPCRINFNAEENDIGDNYDYSTWISGNATATTADHLIDTGTSPFVADMLYSRVKNTTDTTYAYITAVNSTSDVTLSSDIFVDTEGYEIKNSKYVIPVPGKYSISSEILWDDVVADKRYQVQIKVNYSTYIIISYDQSALAVYLKSTTGIECGFSISDIITVNGYQDTGVGTVDVYGSLRAHTFMQIKLISKD